MKSAIFQEQKRAPEPRAVRKQTVKKRPNTQSPFVASPVSHGLKWNLDDMIASYTSNGLLPTPLSPTLPPKYGEQPPSRLEGSAPASRLEGSAPESHPEDEADDESDIDNLPMSLLSPTLPNLGEQKPTTPAPLAHPLPKKPSTVSSVLNGNARGKVRWINKLSDGKPRFLLRILFKAQLAKYKSTFRPRSPAKVQGLGIIEPKKAPEPKQRWYKVARDIQMLNDKVRAKDPLFSVILEFDWLLATAIAHDTEEKQRSKALERSWNSLYAEIPLLVQRIEKYIKTNNVSDKKKSYLSFLVGVLAIAKALLLRRVNSLIKNDLSSHAQEKGDTRKIHDLQAQIIHNYAAMEDHFAESQSFFANCPAPATIFPKSWHGRAPSIARPPDTVLSPSTDKYYLPLGPYLDFKDAAAYLYRCVREFCDHVGPEINGGAKYALQVARKTPK